jgi:hypothetical protein
MAGSGFHWPSGCKTAFAAVLLTLFAGPAPAFFRPTPVSKIKPPHTKPIIIPKKPPNTPPGGGGTTGGGTTGGPSSAPEPNSLALAFLGSSGLGLFAASRRLRRRRK